MQENDIHDLSDDPDYAASQQQGSASMMASGGSKRGSGGEPESGEVVYVKDHVTIHPTQLASERISGRLMLFKQGSSLFMSWLPYKDQSSSARLSEKDMNLYSIRMVPFAEVRSIRRHTPALGWQYIIVVLSSGLAFPPLYFYSGGVREFLATVKRHVFLARSAEDSNVFLLDDQNPLQRTLSSLELPRAVSVSSGSVGLASRSGSSPKQNQDRVGGENSITSQLNRRHRPKVHHDPAHDISIQLLEKFSLVTKFARETTSQLFGENQNNGFGSIERRSRNQPHVSPQKTAPPHIIPQKTVLPHVSPQETAYPHVSPQKTTCDEQEVSDEGPVEPDPLELDKLSLVWGKPRQAPLVSEEWAKYLDFEGRVVDSQELRKRIFYGGVEHNLRKQAWPLLLGYWAYESTYAEREYLKSVKKSEYETIKCQWQSISTEQAKRFTKYRERKSLIEKDVVRTDRSHSFYDGDDNPNVKVLRDILLTYSFYNFDLGYCQGMSDLLSPILYVMEDESESFWCFVALMQRLGPNFNRDQNGMHSQLFALSKLVELLDIPMHTYFEQNDCLNYFFCFRWVLIQFKREFDYEQTMRLWEVLWTHYLSEHLHLYVCVAILKRYRKKIMGERMDFDTLLKFINELSGHIDLDAILRDAEALCIWAGENGASCIPPGTPPSLSVEDEYLYAQQDDVL